MKKLLLLLTTFFVAAVLYGADSEKLLTVVFTNDSQGMAWSFDEPGQTGIGGLAARKTLIDEIRAEVQGKGGDVILLSAGDVTLGDPRSNVCGNLPMIKGMNLIGYDAMVIGNHEFDFGLDGFDKMQKTAEFPFLSSNIYDRETLNPFAKEYVEKKMSNGVKVAVIGVTTRETEQITKDGLEGKLILTDPLQEVQKRIKTLREKNDVVIALSHLGYYEGEKSFDGYNSDVALAKIPGIDLIVGGHTQIQLERPVKIGETSIVQTSGYGKWVGRFDIVLKNDKIVSSSYKLYPVNLKNEKGKLIGKSIKENKAVLDMLNGFKCDFSTAKIGDAVIDFSGDRKVVRFQEAELGNLIADVMKQKVGADIAFLNGGSIRQGFAKGIITERDIYNVFPFNDTLYVAKMTGAQLQEIFDFFAAKGGGTGGFLQVAGVTMKIYKGAALEVKVNGQPLQNNKSYTVAINSFLANGGDGYSMIAAMKNLKNTGYSIPAILVDYVRDKKNVDCPGKGRIDIVK